MNISVFDAVLLKQYISHREGIAVFLVPYGNQGGCPTFMKWINIHGIPHIRIHLIVEFRFDASDEENRSAKSGLGAIPDNPMAAAAAPPRGDILVWRK